MRQRGSRARGKSGRRATPHTHHTHCSTRAAPLPIHPTRRILPHAQAGNCTADTYAADLSNCNGGDVTLDPSMRFYALAPACTDPLLINPVAPPSGIVPACRTPTYLISETC